jgi:nucleoside phosphorylase
MSGSARCDLLVLGAFGPELAPLAAALGGLGEGVEGRAGSIGAVGVVARPMGVGLAAAGAGAARHLAELRPRAVAMVGTCGAYAGRGLAIGDVVVARRSVLADPSVVSGTSEFPAPVVLSVSPDAALAAALEGCGARPADVATTLAVTVDAATAESLAAALHVQAEHLEAHGVAMAAAAAGVPLAAVLGVANVVGPDARAQWREHNAEASRRAVEVLLRWIERAPGPLAAGAGSLP